MGIKFPIIDELDDNTQVRLFELVASDSIARRNNNLVTSDGVPLNTNNKDQLTAEINRLYDEELGDIKPVALPQIDPAYEEADIPQQAEGSRPRQEVEVNPTENLLEEITNSPAFEQTLMSYQSAPNVKQNVKNKEQILKDLGYIRLAPSKTRGGGNRYYEYFPAEGSSPARMVKMPKKFTRYNAYVTDLQRVWNRMINDLQTFKQTGQYLAPRVPLLAQLRESQRQDSEPMFTFVDFADD
ncbi:MAG: hypothetical protein IPM51_12250 [Sphingobacteriaceae bacterium]|nr:hypothetical protein [Sphingobacteriaceae bacterium]